MITNFCCDLLKNIYLCGINNNSFFPSDCSKLVVICLKISIFVVSTTTEIRIKVIMAGLWFAWKYLSLWYQQQRALGLSDKLCCCDLLENIYLCGINNNLSTTPTAARSVVICLKISIFVVSTTTCSMVNAIGCSCDLLENIYLCGINNN